MPVIQPDAVVAVVPAHAQAGATEVVEVVVQGPVKIVAGHSVELGVKGVRFLHALIHAKVSAQAVQEDVMDHVAAVV